jgi:hypothetical protein
MLGRHALGWVALGVVVVAVGIGIAATQAPATHDAPAPAAGPVPTAPPVPASQRMPSVGRVTPGATSVRAFGATGRGNRDDTRAFAAAMAAARRSKVRFASGPLRPQAVVAVPAGTYRLWGLRFRDDIRLEVAAGAVLEPTANPSAGTGPEDARALIQWDGPAGRPLTNVSIVGVGRRAGAPSRFVAHTAPGWDLSRSFIFDLDADRTRGSNVLGAMQLLNVRGFLVKNVLSLQNGSADSGAGPHGYASPTSSRAAIVLAPRNDTPKGGPYYDPHDGAIVNHYNVGGPYGYGPNQITSAHNVRLDRIFSSGGTALRLETDATLRKSFGGEVRDVVARHVVGVDCNRAVVFAPHEQRNRDVHVFDVLARSCQQGVLESKDESLPSDRRGSFTGSSVTSIRVIGGDAAQLPVSGDPGRWQAGPSSQPFARDAYTTWVVAYSDVHCTGQFTKRSDSIDVDGAFTVPTCD